MDPAEAKDPRLDDWLPDVEAFDTRRQAPTSCCHGDQSPSVEGDCIFCEILTVEGGPLGKVLDPAIYVPVCDLTLDSIPVAIRSEKILKAIQEASRRVVRIFNRKISKDRPEGDQFKNCESTRGTGFVFYRNENSLVVSTNKHVIFNAEEAQNSEIWLNYDGGDTWKDMVRIFKGMGTIKTIANDDFTLAVFQMQEESLRHSDRAQSMDKIKFTMAHIPDKELFQTSRRLEQALVSTDGNSPTYVCLISHPHGQSKRVSFGTLLTEASSCEARENAQSSATSKQWEGRCLIHTAPSEPGSSGAPLLLFSTERLPVPSTSIWYHVARLREDPEATEAPMRKVARLQVNNMKLFNVDWTGSEPVLCHYATRCVRALAPLIQDAILRMATKEEHSEALSLGSLFEVLTDFQQAAKLMFFGSDTDEATATGTQLGKVIMEEIRDTVLREITEAGPNATSTKSEGTQSPQGESDDHSLSDSSSQARASHHETRDDKQHPALGTSARLVIKLSIFNWICAVSSCILDGNSPIILEWPCSQEEVRSAIADLQEELVSRHSQEEGNCGQHEERDGSLKDVLESFDLIEDCLPCPCQAVWHWLRAQGRSPCPYPQLLPPSISRPRDAPLTWPWPLPDSHADVIQKEPTSCILLLVLTTVRKMTKSVTEIWDETDAILRLVHALSILKRRWRKNTTSELREMRLEIPEEFESNDAPGTMKPLEETDEDFLALVSSFLDSLQHTVGAVTLFNYHHSHPIFSLTEDGLNGMKEISPIIPLLVAEDHWLHLMNHTWRHNNATFLKKSRCDCGRPSQGQINDAIFRVKMLLKKAERETTSPPPTQTPQDPQLGEFDPHSSTSDDVPDVVPSASSRETPGPSAGNSATVDEVHEGEEQDPVERLLQYWMKSDAALWFLHSSAVTEEFTRMAGSSDADFGELMVGTLPLYAQLCRQCELFRNNAVSTLLRLESRLERGRGDPGVPARAERELPSPVPDVDPSLASSSVDQSLRTQGVKCMW